MYIVFKIWNIILQLLSITHLICLSAISLISGSELARIFDIFLRTVCKDQELKPSEPKFCPQNQNGKKLILQMVKIQREHMVNRVSSFFPKDGHSATETELKNNMNTHNVKRHQNSDTKDRQQRTTTKLPPWNGYRGLKP